jgi:hypothetical protein
MRHTGNRAQAKTHQRGRVEEELINQYVSQARVSGVPNTATIINSSI